MVFRPAIECVSATVPQDADRGVVLDGFLAGWLGGRRGLGDALFCYTLLYFVLCFAWTDGRVK